MQRNLFVVLLFALLLFPSSVLAQHRSAATSQAYLLAAQSIAALTGGNTIGDVTLTGNVTWNGSGGDTGTATLKGLGTGESRMDLTLTGGTRTEIRDAQTSVPLGQWINPDNTSGVFAFQNCQTDANWFFPALGSLAAGPNVVLSYIGREDRNGGAVQHLQSYLYQLNSPPGLSMQQLSSMDFYLDATTLLPVAITYNAHPDDGTSSNLPVEVDFSNYQNVGGALVPMRIQRYLQGSLLVDLTLSGASFNTGLSLSNFTVNLSQTTQTERDEKTR
jgi:hypothetical protein